MRLVTPLPTLKVSLPSPPRTNVCPFPAVESTVNCRPAIDPLAGEKVMEGAVVYPVPRFLTSTPVRRSPLKTAWPVARVPPLGGAANVTTGEFALVHAPPSRIVTLSTAPPNVSEATA